MANSAPSSWVFSPYEKIPENPQRWTGHIDSLRSFKKTSWAVSEKIHGAHFSLVTDGESLRAAKRRGFIEEDDNFFGYRAAVERVRDAVLRLHSIVAAELPSVDRIAIHGELFGGYYPHPDVPAVEGVWAVQTGIAYCPHIDFLAYDVAVERDTSESSGAAKREYLDFDLACSLMDLAHLPRVPTLFVGSYEDACAFPNEFSSTIPALLGLPKLSGENLAEGVVVKPMRASLVRVRGERPVLKRKIAQFAEDSRYHQAMRHEPPPAAPGMLGMLRVEATERTTEPRLWSVASKIGRITREDATLRERLIHELKDDVLESLKESYPQIETLSPRAVTALNAYVGDEARALVELVFERS